MTKSASEHKEYIKKCYGCMSIAKMKYCGKYSVYGMQFIVFSIPCVLQLIYMKYKGQWPIQGKDEVM